MCLKQYICNTTYIYIYMLYLQSTNCLYILAINYMNLLNKLNNFNKLVH